MSDMSQAQRKKLQRQRDRAAGWSEVTVRVATDQIEALRAFAASLPPPTLQNHPDQLDLIDHIEHRDKP